VRSREVLIENNAKRTRVISADDQPPMLAEIERVLGETYEIVDTVGDGLCLLESVARLDPDVIVSDITMPGIDGFGAARGLSEPVRVSHGARGSRLRAGSAVAGGGRVRREVAAGRVGQEIRVADGEDMRHCKERRKEERKK